MFDAVEEYQKTNPKYLKTVHFVLFNDKDLYVYSKGQLGPS
jgi:O-acetyl-ADP-ribose deacetylase (regulator of RNase III)